ILEKAVDLCAETLLEALELFLNNQVSVTKQENIHSIGFYCGRRIPGDELINWEWSSERIHNFVRAITDPAPGARTFIEDRSITIWKTELITEAPRYIGTPGEVVGRRKDGNVVKTGDATILIKEVSDPTENGERVVPSFRVGTRLGLN